jgi:hypothetical protein
MSLDVHEPAPSDTSLLASRSASPPSPMPNLPGPGSLDRPPRTTTPLVPPPPPVAVNDVQRAVTYWTTERKRMKSSNTKWIHLQPGARDDLLKEVPRYKADSKWSASTCPITYELLHKYPFCPDITWPPLKELIESDKHPELSRLFLLYAEVSCLSLEICGSTNLISFYSVLAIASPIGPRILRARA